MPTLSELRTGLYYTTREPTNSDDLTTSYANWLINKGIDDIIQRTKVLTESIAITTSADIAEYVVTSVEGALVLPRVDVYLYDNSPLELSTERHEELEHSLRSPTSGTPLKIYFRLDGTELKAGLNPPPDETHAGEGKLVLRACYYPSKLVNDGDSINLLPPLVQAVIEEAARRFFEAKGADGIYATKLHEEDRNNLLKEFRSMMHTTSEANRNARFKARRERS